MNVDDGRQITVILIIFWLGWICWCAGWGLGVKKNWSYGEMSRFGWVVKEVRSVYGNTRCVGMNTVFEFASFLS